MESTGITADEFINKCKAGNYDAWYHSMWTKDEKPPAVTCGALLYLLLHTEMLGRVGDVSVLVGK